MRALLLCIDMHNGFHGSFLHILEYGEYFLRQGYEVHVGSVLISEENKKVAEDTGLKVHRILNVPINGEWDLVYALHNPIFPALLAKGLKYKRAISATLSAFFGIETIPPSIMWPYFDLFTAVSEEIVHAYIKRFGVKNIFEVIPNRIPLSFMEAKPKNHWNANLKKVAVISNHCVPELFVTRRFSPFQIDLIGNYYQNSKRCTPELLHEYDAVITIGKTIQFCLGLAIPVFQYDKYGGCGWITPDNLLSEEKTNFSGRGTKKLLTPKEIISQLSEGYSNATKQAGELCEIARDRYDLSKLINKQLTLAENKPLIKPSLKREALLYAQNAAAVFNYM